MDGMDAGGFDAASVFGASAIAAIRQDASLVGKLVFSDPYAEGTGVRLQVTTMAEVEIVLRLAAAKTAN